MREQNLNSKGASMNYFGAKTLALCGLLTFGLLLEASPSMAQSSGFEERTFMYWVPQGEVPPDFNSPTSIAVVVAGPSNAQDQVEFAEYGLAPELRGTLWQSRPTRHIRSGGQADSGTIYWKIDAEHPEPPTAGTIAFTGLESPFILSQKVYRIKVCTSGNCGGFANDGKWHVPSSGGTDTVVIVKAIFLR
jgi:hypothetical protein